MHYRSEKKIHGLMGLKDFMTTHYETDIFYIIYFFSFVTQNEILFKFKSSKPI